MFNYSSVNGIFMRNAIRYTPLSGTAVKPAPSNERYAGEDPGDQSNRRFSDIIKSVEEADTKNGGVKGSANAYARNASGKADFKKLMDTYI
ncbi:MAG: hypothetical protein FWG28_08300 [Clostridiales bacterium]|nr:hypothetical protein [Clostridiales bacterium]